MTHEATTAILTAQALSSCFMAGLIWFVQIVHYPLLSSVAPSNFHEYHRRHTSRTSLVVAPVMLIELASAAMLLWSASSTASISNESDATLRVVRGADALGPLAPHVAWLGAALVAICWLLTFLVMVPLHNRLSSGRDDVVIRRLVAFNWARTIAWSLRAVISVAMLITPNGSAAPPGVGP